MRFLIVLIFLWSSAQAQVYQNPIIHADYSDPDAIRVGQDYYMTASSFNAIPGLPILHSKDLVNWQLIGYALKRQPPYDHYSKPQHGNGVWAPSIRYHNNEFYIYYPDPDFGIYLTKSKSINGPWSEPLLIAPGKGLIDPCPLWDSDGKAYLVHAFAGSRAGIKSIIVIKQMNAEGTKIIDDGVLVYDGHDLDPTIEGPKLYKRNGYYYIFAPAGGVSTGWQLALRSKNIYGPYERKVVMDQGETPINGPHQGAWVNTPGGEDWFIHFQDKEAYGRIVHLQPMQWKNDWPAIGIDKDGDGKGEPVLQYKKPNVGKTYPATALPTEDEFNTNTLGLQWQWQANPRSTWAFLGRGVLRLFSDTATTNLWSVPNLLLQKFPAEKFVSVVKFSFRPRLEGEQFGFVVMGTSYAAISIIKKADGNYLYYTVCKNADKGAAENAQQIAKLTDSIAYFRVDVEPGAVCSFHFSKDGHQFTAVGEPFTAQPGRWIGAKLGFFCIRTTLTNDAGFADIDWIRFGW